MYSPELTSKIAIWRAKALDGSLTLDEMREAIRLMRAGRLTAVAPRARKTAQATAEDLLGEIANL